MLIKKQPTGVNTQDNAGILILSHSLHSPHIFILGCTPLHVACANQHEKCIQLLLQHGADMEIQDKEDKIALELAPPSMHKIIVGKCTRPSLATSKLTSLLQL